MDMKKLFEVIESKRDEYITFLKEIAEIESPTPYKEGVDAVGRYFIEKAAGHGWKTEVFEQKTAGNGKTPSV